jgi:hypothetical protein
MSSKQRVENVVEYNKLSKIQLKSFFGKLRDPSEDLESEIRAFFISHRARFNRKVESAFDLTEGEYTKFEFFWSPQRARRVMNDSDRVGSRRVAFRSKADVTLLYLKARSLILFTTEYLFAITEPGCGGKGLIYVSGGGNYALDEIYFNKITTVGAYHNEEMYDVVDPGCLGGRTSRYTSVQDGFKIRAGESFTVTASQSYAQELRDARSMINENISGTN